MCKPAHAEMRPNHLRLFADMVVAHAAFRVKAIAAHQTARQRKAAAVATPRPHRPVR